MREVNPYRPGFNQSPAILAGRRDVVDAIGESLDVAALDGRSPRPLLLVGSRGVGKTVLLARARSIAAEQHSWISVDVEVHPERPFTPALVARLRDAARAYDQTPPSRGGWQVDKATLKASVAGVGGVVQMSRGPDSSAPSETVLEDVLSEVMTSALDRRTGLLLTLDEVHLATIDELAALAACLQHAVTEGWPLVAALAGLPSMQDSRRMVTYLERGEWHSLGLLSEAETLDALVGPARDAGRPLDDDAAMLLVDASGGYPYAIQVLGHHAWRASHGATAIDIDAARAGRAAAQRDLSAGLYASRWNDAPPREQEYLIALAGLLLEGRSPIGADVAHVLGAEAKATSYLRARLLRKGTIYADGRVLRFAVPGMASWIAAQALDE